MIDPLALIAAPYHPPVPVRGQVYDALRHRWRKVTAWKTTAFGAWPSVGRNQPRPIMDEEFLRAVETESAASVAHHWGYDIATVIRYRAKVMADPRNDSPGTTRLHRENAPARELALQPSRAATAKRAADADTVIATAPVADAAERLGRTRKAIGIRRGRIGIATPGGRAPEALSESYGCWRVVGVVGQHAKGGRLYEAVCSLCGTVRRTSIDKLKRSVNTVRCSRCPARAAE